MINNLWYSNIKTQHLENVKKDVKTHLFPETVPLLVWTIYIHKTQSFHWNFFLLRKEFLQSSAVCGNHPGYTQPYWTRTPLPHKFSSLTSGNNCCKTGTVGVATSNKIPAGLSQNVLHFPEVLSPPSFLKSSHFYLNCLTF